MKKGISVVLLAVLVAGGVFAQEEERREKQNAVFLDVGPLFMGLLLGGFGIGAGYERAINNSFSAMGHFDILMFTLRDDIDYKEPVFAFDIDVHGRWYPLKSALAKLFVDVGVGYGSFSDKVEPKAAYIETMKYTVHILSIGAKAGWKFILGPGFVLEPSLGYSYAFELANNRPGGATKLTIGGLSYSIGLGWAF